MYCCGIWVMDRILEGVLQAGIHEENGILYFAEALQSEQDQLSGGHADVWNG